MQQTLPIYLIISSEETKVHNQRRFHFHLNDFFMDFAKIGWVFFLLLLLVFVKDDDNNEIEMIKIQAECNNSSIP